MPMQLRIVMMVAVSGVGACQLDAQTVTPKFAWPVGSTAQMIVETRTKITGGAGGMALDDSSLTRTTTSMAVRAHADGLEISSGPGVSEKIVPGSRPSDFDLSSLVTMESKYIVSRDGRFVRVNNLAEYKRRADSLMAPTLERVRAAAPGMLATLEKSTSPDNLSRSIERMWNDQQLLFYGRSWTPGDSTATMVSLPSPLGPDQPMRLPRVVRFDGVKECADAAPKTCWQFTSRVTITREALRPTMLETLKQMGLPESMLDQMPIAESTGNTTILVDAATMLPMRIEIQSSSENNTGLASFKSVSSIVTTYRWK